MPMKKYDVFELVTYLRKCPDIFLKSSDIPIIIYLPYWKSQFTYLKKNSQAKGQSIMDKLLPLLKHEEEKPLILAKVINYSF